jgi:leucyl-tRNA synthetase
LTSLKTSNRYLDYAARVLCRELRKKQTPAEKIFWQHIRNRKFQGLKFYRQFPIFYDTENNESFFIADFFCQEKKLVIEIDGKIHYKMAKNDSIRSEILANLGLHIIRFENDEIENDMATVLRDLKIIITKWS